MQRTYLPLLALSAAIAAPAWAASVFSSQPLDQARFAVLAQPVGKSDWKLLVLEQIKPEPLCWEKRSDGLIDPALNRFDFSGICSRYRLRLEQQGNKVSLLAMTPSQPTELLVGRGTMSQRDREAFVAIELEPDWSLERRAYGSQTLSHVYFANGTPLSQLIAKASRNAADRAPANAAAAMKPLKPLPPQTPTGSGPIALQVIPFKP